MDHCLMTSKLKSYLLKQNKTYKPDILVIRRDYKVSLFQLSGLWWLREDTEEVDTPIFANFHLSKSLSLLVLVKQCNGFVNWTNYIIMHLESGPNEILASHIDALWARRLFYRHSGPIVNQKRNSPQSKFF